jgi:uncharacterized sulfatase
MTHGDPTRGGRHGDEGLKIGRQGIKPITDFLDSRRERPFFIWYAPMLPHQPHNPPMRLLDKYKDKTESLHMAKYWAMVEWFDETCGQVLAELDKRQLRENTLVVYLADNGWRQNLDKPGFDEWSKRSRFDGGLRTPVMLRWPGHIKPRRDEATLVSSIDLAPTILSACGAKVVAEMPGVSLVDSSAAAKRNAVFGAIFEHDIPDIDRASPGLQHRWCIDDRWKLIVSKSGEEELFDVLADPHEQENAIATNVGIATRLRKKLDSCWTP